MVLVNPMVPTPGEAPGQWWEATGQEQARIDHYRRIGLQRNEFDPIEDFFHDVPQAVRQEAFSQPEPPASTRPTHAATANEYGTASSTAGTPHFRPRRVWIASSTRLVGMNRRSA